MKSISTRRLIATCALIILTAAITSQAALVEGLITDAVSGDPVSRVTVRVEGSGQTTLGNDDGRYRLRLDPGSYTLRFSHVAHYSKSVDIIVSDQPDTVDVVLQPSIIELPGTKVYTRAYDPAQRIIVEAIAHKQALLDQIHDYTLEAYTKLVIRKLEDTAAGDYILIAETQLKGFFEKPDHFKEIITARKQSSNIQADQNLVALGRIFNFNENRIDIGTQAIVTPTAEDALDYYNYYLLDTTLIDGRPAFRLEVEPKNNTDPLFKGEVLIADSTYAVVGVDFGFNDALDAPFLKNPHFNQRFARFDNDIWWPVEVRFRGDVSFPLPGLPRLTFSYVAALSRLVFNQGIPAGTFDEYALEVAPEADKVDSTTWDKGALIPLTNEEEKGYAHIDSVAHGPMTVKKAALSVVLLSAVTLETNALIDFFRFDGVEGAYLGAGHTFRDLLPRTSLYARTGWAFSGEYWEHSYWLDYRFPGRKRFRVTAGFDDRIVARPTLFAGERYNPTLIELWNKRNPLNYYLEKGFGVGVGLRPTAHSNLYVEYADRDQYSVRNATDYAIRDLDRKRRPNAPIINGKMRSLSAALNYDSRALIKVRDQSMPVASETWTYLEGRFETASPDLIENDFDFRRYSVEIKRYQTLPGFGLLSLYAYGGMSDRALPPQRYFTVDFGAPNATQELSFKTLSDSLFVGDRVLALYASHDFGPTLFRKSGLPLVKEIPLSLLVYGGTFWADFRAASSRIDGVHLRTAAGGYSELGFGFGRIPPLFMQVYFTWQTSHYHTEKFSVGVGFSFSLEGD